MCAWEPDVAAGLDWRDEDGCAGGSWRLGVVAGFGLGVRLGAGCRADRDEAADDVCRI